VFEGSGDREAFARVKERKQKAATRWRPVFLDKTKLGQA